MIRISYAHKSREASSTGAPCRTPGFLRSDRCNGGRTQALFGSKQPPSWQTAVASIADQANVASTSRPSEYDKLIVNRWASWAGSGRHNGVCIPVFFEMHFCVLWLCSFQQASQVKIGRLIPLHDLHQSPCTTAHPSKSHQPHRLSPYHITDAIHHHAAKRRYHGPLPDRCSRHHSSH